MRKTIVSVLTAGILALNFCVYAQGPAEKFGRGIANTATGWLEVPLEIGRKNSSEGAASAIFVGPFAGLAKAAWRTFSGVYDVLTFFIPAPRDYDSLVKPDFVLGEEE